MTSHLPCSKCGQPIDFNAERCPFCDVKLMDKPENGPTILSTTEVTAIDDTVLYSTEDSSDKLSPYDRQDGNRKDLETICPNPGATSQLFEKCLLIAQADNTDDVLKLVKDALNTISYTSAILLRDPKGLHVYSINHPPSSVEVRRENEPQPHEWLNLAAEKLERYFTPTQPILFVNLDSATGVGTPDIPIELLKTLKRLGSTCYVLLSVFVEGKLYALLALGSDQRICFNTQNTETYRNFAGFLSTTLEKLKTNEAIGQRLTVLERLDSVNRSISAVTDVDHLYQAIHQQMTASLGDINFLIALYDADTNQIEIPYAFEEDHLINIPPFPLGEGLTSILIKTRQPLMIVEDTERQAVELGAKTVGQPAKSWLGVPLIVGGDVIGALIVQDLEREHRFDEEDKRMLNMLSTQVAISLRNAHLLRESQIRVEREQVITELTNKLWASTDVETILRTALIELGRTMSVSRGFIQLDMSEQTRNVN